jgi:hypothetical protein
VTILTAAFKVQGHIELLVGARVTDYMEQARDFIAVTDATVWELTPEGRKVLTAPFINVSRDHIQIVSPGD